MIDDKTPQWLRWAREIQALGQTGLTYCENEYERQRNQRIMDIAAEITEKYSNIEKKVLIEGFNKQLGYATPKVDVRGAVVKDNQILLVQERSDGKWCMPGGWADIGESPAEAIEREVSEESGFKVKAEKIIGVFEANRYGRPQEFYHAYKIIFFCRLNGGKATTSYETTGVEFYSFDNIPQLSVNRTNERHLAEVQKHLKDTNRYTFFD